MLDSKTTTLPDRPISRSAEEAWSTAAAILLAAFFLATSLYIAARRQFWFDEIFTALFAGLPNVADIWKGLRSGSDLQPLPYYLIVRASEAIFGRGEFAARIPSAIGLTGGVLFTFSCVRRFAGGAYGVLAMLIVMCSFVPYYGHEARPYGLLFLFSAAMLWVWLNGEGRENRAAWIFGVLACASVMIHFYAVLTLVPFGVYELVQRRWFSPRLIAGTIGMAAGLAMLAPQLTIGRHITSLPNWAAQPSFAVLRYIFDSMLPTFLMAAIAILAALAVPRKSPPPAPMPAAERLCWCFLLIPPAGFAAAELATHSFYIRYFIATAPGMAAAVSILLYRHFGAHKWITAALLMLFGAVGIARQAAYTWRPESINGEELGTARQVIAMEDTFTREGKFYIAVTDEHVWAESWYYSKHPERYVFLQETDSIPRRLRSVVPSLLCWNIADLKPHARETVVMSDLSTLQELKDAGLYETIRQASPFPIFYLQ